MNATPNRMDPCACGHRLCDHEVDGGPCTYVPLLTRVLAHEADYTGRLRKLECKCEQFHESERKEPVHV